MFIKKKDYKELCKRVSTLESGVASLSAALLRLKQSDANAHAGIRAELGDRATRAELSKYANVNDITDVLFGFAQDIDELTGKVAEVNDAINDENGDFQQERKFLQGVHGIFAYGEVKQNGE